MTSGHPEPPAAPRLAQRAGRLGRGIGSRAADVLYEILAAAACLAGLLGIGYLVWKTAAETGAVWREIGVWSFLTGQQWIPFDPAGEPAFGALPFIYGTVLTSAIALVLAVPLAVGAALATTVLLPRPLREPISQVVDLLAAVPSVVYGLWGITVMVPALTPMLEWIARQGDRLGIGFISGPVTSGSYLIGGIVLAIMILPIIAAVTREVFLTVPDEQKEAAYAVGATRWEMIRYSMLPWARSGIVGASALGLGRAVGETIALFLLLGNVPGVGGSIIGPGSTLASIIALEYNEAIDLHLAALTALALVLFVLAFVVNAIARMLVRRGPGGHGEAIRRALLDRGLAGLTRRRRAAANPAAPDSPAADPPPAPRDLPAAARARMALVRDHQADSATPVPRVSLVRRIGSRSWEAILLLALAAALVPLGMILFEILKEGLPAISPSFFTELPSPDPFVAGGGIENALIGTLILMGIATALAAPMGIMTALFINDVAPRLGRVGRAVGGAAGFLVDVLLGVPSIVVGVTVNLGLVVVMGRFSALAGGVALAIIMFPIVVRTTDEILRLVPTSLKEGAEAIGAGHWRLTWSVVLPAALPGITTGVLLALARASGETAPLLFTSLGNQFTSTALLEPIAALPQLIFERSIDVQTPESLELAWGAALVLVAIILLLNVTARLITRLAPRISQ